MKRGFAELLGHCLGQCMAPGISALPAARWSFRCCVLGSASPALGLITKAEDAQRLNEGWS